jgi:hypothetical protein
VDVMMNSKKKQKLLDGPVKVSERSFHYSLYSLSVHFYLFVR